MSSLTVKTIPILSDNYAYVVSHGATALVIDPGEPRPIREYVRKQNLDLEAVLLTHHHGDHVGGAGTLQRAFGSLITSPDSQRIAGTDHMVRKDTTFRVGALEVRVLALPGHTSTHVGYYFPQLNALFTGDALFGAGCGRLFEGTAEQMLRSLRSATSSGDETLVYFGHEYTEENLLFALSIEPHNELVRARLETTRKLLACDEPTAPSTIAEEKQTNPFLRVSEPSIKAALGMHDDDDAAVFAELRRRKDRF
ncbi:MAG: hydroxyacylglutathione hydrolase [Chitinivibrionales bacterium]|nr:hydroxyacylglutathione hydrolase [Chitinivibrionales bacterium]MBD3357167.1 hydroxyacylglutathione hydrolase [Chitinivibrionales bacterium]